MTRSLRNPTEEPRGRGRFQAVLPAALLEVTFGRRVMGSMRSWRRVSSTKPYFAENARHALFVARYPASMIFGAR